MIFDQFCQFFDMAFLVGFHLFPESLAVGAFARVIEIIIFDAPQAFVLDDKLVHQIIDMV